MAELAVSLLVLLFRPEILAWGAGLMFYHPYLTSYKPAATKEAPPIPDSVKTAARLAGASHISADGNAAYREHYGSALVCFWDEESKEFGSWFRYLVEMPEGVVEV